MLSEVIEQVQRSIRKEPQVKNYATLLSLKPKLQKMLKDKGDFTIPVTQFADLLNN